jgi:uncharacterized protein
MMIKNTDVPDSILTRHCAVLGMTGSGKSSKLRVLVEHLLVQQRPITIFDPKGDWYGLKLTADGMRDAFPVVIFGGEYADIPINDKQGAMVAEIVATAKGAFIVCTFGMSTAGRTRFFRDFAEKYFLTVRGKRHLVVDEVHNFAPKQIMHNNPDTTGCLSAMLTLATEGRGRGITLMVASQRPQKVHNDVLDACATLIAGQILHVASREAIKAWIDGVGDKVIGRTVLDSLAQLETPEAWVWSPMVRFGPERITFPLFTTFDSFHPDSREVAIAPLKAAPGIDELRKHFAAATEPDAGKPGKGKVQSVPAGVPPETETLRLEIESLTYRLGEANRLLREEKQINEQLSGALHHYQYGLQNVLFAVATAVNPARFAPMRLTAGDGINISVDVSQLVGPPPTGDMPRVKADPAFTGPAITIIRSATPATESIAAGKPEPLSSLNKLLPQQRAKIVSQHEGAITKPQQKILNALRWWEALTCSEKGITREQLAWAAGYSVGGGTFMNLVGSLRSAGWAEYPAGNLVELTQKGRSLAEEIANADSGKEVWTRVQGKLSNPQIKIMTALLNHHSTAISREQLADEAGYSMEGGTFMNLVGSLRTLGFVEYPEKGMVRAMLELFW